MGVTNLQRRSKRAILTAMKLLVLLPLLLASCVSRPSVTEIKPDGTKIRYSTGVNLMAEVDEVLAEVEAPGGIHLRYAAKREDGTRVPVAGINAWLARGLALIQGRTTDLKTKTDGAVALGAQKTAVQQAGIAAQGKATSEAIGAGAEIAPLTITPP